MHIKVTPTKHTHVETISHNVETNVEIGSHPMLLALFFLPWRKTIALHHTLDLKIDYTTTPLLH